MFFPFFAEDAKPKHPGPGAGGPISYYHPFAVASGDWGKLGKITPDQRLAICPDGCVPDGRIWKVEVDRGEAMVGLDRFTMVCGFPFIGNALPPGPCWILSAMDGTAVQLLPAERAQALSTGNLPEYTETLPYFRLVWIDQAARVCDFVFPFWWKGRGSEHRRVFVGRSFF
jgi:hypothetical protein